jgi:hypothetical protein
MCDRSGDIGKGGRIVDVDKRVRAASHRLDVAAQLTELGTERLLRPE